MFVMMKTDFFLPAQTLHAICASSDNATATTTTLYRAQLWASCFQVTYPGISHDFDLCPDIGIYVFNTT